MRVAILGLLLLMVSATARAVEDDPDKISNDKPDRPLQMPPASSETKEAFDDFERFARRGAWERATKALYAIPEGQTTRFVDGQDGFIISVARKRHAVLAGLSPEGQAAYRLFYDADAKKLLDQAEGLSEQATLERLYSAYFLTSVGDNAADRLGDLYFEKGEYDQAANCWLAILRERTDSELTPALLTVKAALALARAGRRSELDAIGAEMADRYAGDLVTIGGRKAKATEHLKRILGEPGSSRGPAPEPESIDMGGGPPALADTITATWQLRFGASVTAGMTPVESAQWESTSFNVAVPRVAVEGRTLFANYVGHVFAVDLASGKMLWRSSSFHNLELAAMQGQSQSSDPKRFAILAAPGFVWSLGRDPKEMNQQAVSRLACRRAENGEVIWQSSDLPEYAGMDLVGIPILARGTIFVAGKSSTSMNDGQGNSPRQFVLAIRPRDGKPLWKTEVGTFREAQQYYYYAMADTSPQPRLVYRAGSIYLDTHNGILARLDSESGLLDWGYGYATEAVQGQDRFMFFNRMGNQDPTPTVSAPLQAGDSLLIKGAKADRIRAIDPDRMKVLWDRPIAKSARLVGVDDRTIYLGGPELGALDRVSRTLRWSTPLPGGSDDGRVIVRPDGLWQLTPRGIFEVDPETGRVRRIFRGDDAGAAGGDLILTDRWLLTISNRTISAYPRGLSGGERAVRADAAAPRMGRSDD